MSYKIGDHFVNPTPGYISQFASPELVWDYLVNDLKGEDDPKWRTFGFKTIEEYEFWIHRICGIVCTKMVLELFSPKAAEMNMAELVEKGISMGGYKLYDEDGKFIDLGWFYAPLVELSKEYGVDGQVCQTLTIDQLCQLIFDNKYPIVSVNPRVIRGDEDTCEKKGGHLVLAVGFRWEENGCTGVYVHNPSGKTKETQQCTFIPIKRFEECFAGRGFALFKGEGK